MRLIVEVTVCLEMPPNFRFRADKAYEDRRKNIGFYK